jgi:phosphoenolpyruvate carboxykinase (GTP)
VPTPDALNGQEIGISRENMERLLTVDRPLWERETEDQKTFLGQFGDRLPGELRQQEEALQQRVTKVTV